MQQLLRRAVQVYQNEGLAPTITKSTRFVPRYLRHVIGTKGLYGSPQYRNLLCWWNARPYSVDNPFTIVCVDPDEIIHVTGRGPNPGRFQWQDLGTVQGGDWDQSDDRFEDLPVVGALRDHFEDNTEWEDVEFVQHVIDQAKRGHVIWRGCTSKKDVWDACDHIDRLYERIQNQGYRTKQELVQQDGLSPDKYVGGDRFNCYDEVVVDVGRDGQSLFVDGRHRLTIAKILKLDEIPVRISARHEQWQQIRELAARTETGDQLPISVKKHRDHPDLKAVFKENQNERI